MPTSLHVGSYVLVAEKSFEFILAEMKFPKTGAVSTDGCNII